MSLSSMVKQPTAGTLSWRFIQLASGKIPKANMVSRLCITRLVVTVPFLAQAVSAQTFLFIFTLPLWVSSSPLVTAYSFEVFVT